MYWLAQASSGSASLLRYYIDQLTSPTGIVAVVVLLLLASLTLAFERMKWVALGTAIYVASFSYLRAASSENPLPQPFLAVSSLAQPLTAGLLMLVLLAVFKPLPWRRQQLIHPTIIFLVLTQLTYGLVQILSGYATKGLSGWAVWISAFLLLGLGLARWLFDAEHVRSLARAVSYASAALIFGTILLLLFKTDAAFMSQRVAGTTENPQRTGGMLAVSLPFICLLVVDRNANPATRFAHLAIGIAVIIFVLLSGSRTAALTSVIGVALFFRRRLGVAVVLGAVVLCGVLLGLSLFDNDISAVSGRIVDTTDTRSEVWGQTLSTFLAHPVFGRAAEYVQVENAYLSVAAGAGIVGLLPLAGLVLAMIWLAWRISKAQPILGDLQPAGDLFIAGIGQFLCLWMFEAYLLGLVTNFMIVFYALLAVGGLLRERMLTAPMPAQEAVPEEAFADGAPVVA